MNSFHKYSLKNCPKDFSIEFKSLDGNIESIKSNDKKIYACMWHPERYKKFKKTDIINFKNYLGNESYNFVCREGRLPKYLSLKPKVFLKLETKLS